MKRYLDHELMSSPHIRSRVLDKEYAEKLYSALCNIQWYTETPAEPWSCSWRYAGGLVADLRDCEEDYIDFYCGGGEGFVDKEIEADLKDLGWKWQHWPNESPIEPA